MQIQTRQHPSGSRTARLALFHPADANVGLPDVRQPQKGQCADPCLVLVQKKPSATQDRSDRGDDGWLDGWEVDGSTSSWV